MRIPFPLGLVAAPIAATVFASGALLAVKGWWHSPYYASGIHWAWAWWQYLMDPAPSLSMRLMLALTGAGGLAIAAAILRLSWPKKGSDFYGKAGWQTMWGAIRSGLSFSLRPKPDGVLLGKHLFAGFLWLYVSLGKDWHVSLTAATGSGKGVSFVVPNVMNWGGPVFCFSVKRDVLNACAAERERKGDKVFIFDITEENGWTHKWSGFGEVRRGTPDFYDDIQKLMWVIIPETRSTNPYWDNAARKVATAAGVLLCDTPDAQLNIAEVLDLIEDHDYENRIRNMIYSARLEGRPYPRVAVNTLLTWLDRKKEEGAAGVRENITTALSLWHVPRVAAVTSGQDFNLRDIRSKNISVFVCAQPGDIRRLRAIYSLFFTQLVQMNSVNDFGTDPTHRKYRTLIMLDELWALGEMKELYDAFAFIRSFGLRICAVLQNKEQLIPSIGKEGTNNIFKNTRAELIFGGTDMDTAKEVSERAGTNTEVSSSKSRPMFSFFNFTRHTESTSHKGRPLILPQEVERLEEKFVIVQMRGKPPLKLHRIKYYEDPAFRGKEGGISKMPKLEVTIKRDEESPLDAEDLEEV